jgi:hypothetical protein
VTGRTQHCPSVWDRLNADGRAFPPWWDYFSVFTYPDGCAEVFDPDCERPERFASLDEALVWVTNIARDRIAGEVMDQ